MGKQGNLLPHHINIGGDMKIYSFSHGIGQEVKVYDESLLNVVRIDESTMGFDSNDEWKGVELTKWHGEISATYMFQDCAPVNDYVGNDLAWFLISERFMDLLVSLEIQGLMFHALNVRCTNREGCDFTAYVCNILTCIDESAIDLERSKYFIMDIPEVVERYGRPIIHVSHCVLKHEMVEGLDIFRTNNSGVIYMSERVKKAIKKSGITGCAFREIEVV
jgi:hypothetical protein